MQVPSSQTFWVETDGRTAFPEGPGRVSDVIVLTGLDNYVS